MSEKPSAVVPSEVCSAVCSTAIENPTLQITEKASMACSAVCSEAVAEQPITTTADKPEVCSVVCPSAVENPSHQITEKASVACSAACSEAIGEKPSTAMADKPSTVIADKPEVCSVICQSAIDNPSYQITEKASVACSAVCSVAVADKPSVQIGDKPSVQIGDKPSAQMRAPVSAPAGEPTDGVCGDSTCARRYPKGGPFGAAPASTDFGPKPPPGGDDRTVIRCICKSKFCKVIPDPNNPNQKVCVDSSSTGVNRRGSGCVCAPTCPEVENQGACEGECGGNNKTSQYPQQPPVMTVQQLYKMPKTPESLSKEQEYAGLSRKDSKTRRIGYIAPRKATSRYGIQDDEEDSTENDEIKNADLKLVIADLKSKLLDAEDKIEELKSVYIFGHSIT